MQLMVTSMNPELARDATSKNNQTFVISGWSKRWKEVFVLEWYRYEEGSHSLDFHCARIGPYLS
jgi:hypothetical protein